MCFCTLLVIFVGQTYLNGTWMTEIFSKFNAIKLHSKSKGRFDPLKAHPPVGSPQSLSRSSLSFSSFFSSLVRGFHVLDDWCL